MSLAPTRVTALARDAIRAGDPDLVAFVDGTSDEFFLCLFRCSLAGSSRVRVERATFRVALTMDQATPALVWSMSPLQLTGRSSQPLGASVEVGFAPFLKLSGTWADDADRERCYVRAIGEGEADAEWRYARQPEIALDGSHQMTAVLRVPPGQKATVNIALTGVARGRRAGLFPFRAKLPSALQPIVIADG